MKVIEGIEALIGNNFTGEIECIFDKECEITSYIVMAMDGKLLFGSDDIKKHIDIFQEGEVMFKISNRMVRLGLSLLGVGGVGLTSYISIKCYEKAKTIPEEDKKGKFLAWLPAIGSWVVTSGCILGADHLSNKEIATLTAGLGYLAAKSDKIEQKIREKFGDQQVKDIQAEVNKELVKEGKKDPSVTIERTGFGNEHFRETELGREFYCSREHVDWAFKILNQMFKNGKDVNMNTLYELLGLKRTKQGYEFGWPDEKSDYEFGYSLEEPIHHEIVTGEDENGDLMYWIEIRDTPPIYGYLEV